MRKILWPAVGIAGLGVIVGGLLLYRATPVPSSPRLVLAIPGLRDSAPMVAAAPAAAEATEAASTRPPGAVAAPANTEAAAPEQPPGVADAGAGLQVIHVAPRVVHVVPEMESTPSAPVTLTDKSGRAMSRSMPRPAAPPTGLAVAMRPPAPKPAPQPLPNGAVQAAGSTLINVSGQQVRLFGIRPPNPTDVCLAKDGHARPCGEIAREAAAARLASYVGVHCRTPAGQRSDLGQICLDGAGVDVAGFLVGEGFALANAQESNDYVGAEGVARANRRGLWHYR